MSPELTRDPVSLNTNHHVLVRLEFFPREDGPLQVDWLLGDGRRLRERLRPGRSPRERLRPLSLVPLKPLLRLSSLRSSLARGL